MQEETRQLHAELARLRELLPPALNPGSEPGWRPACCYPAGHQPWVAPGPWRGGPPARVVAVHTR